jgi:hypothetical protein
MWAIANYYKDQEEDLEKFKLICRFINPQAAAEIWDEKTVSEAVSDENNDEIWKEILAHSKSGISPSELKKRVQHPEEYSKPEDDLDTIEVVS